MRYINIKPEAHLPIDSPPAQIAEMVKMLDDAGLQLVGTGTTYLQKLDEGAIRKAFEYNKALKSPLIVIGPTETLPMIEKCVKEYNIKVAIHNHGPSDKHFPTPQPALAAITGRGRARGPVHGCRPYKCARAWIRWRHKEAGRAPRSIWHS